jgi:cytochrome P450
MEGGLMEEHGVPAGEFDQTPEALLAMVLQDPGGLEDPQGLLAPVREQCPVFPGPYGVFMVTGYDEAKAIYADHVCFSSAAAAAGEGDGYKLYADSDEQAHAAETIVKRTMFTNDEPDHSRMRRLARESFSVKEIAARQPMIDRITAELIDEVKGLESFDVVRSLGYPLPEQVICEILGVSYEDFEDLEAWSRVITHFPRTRPPTQEEALEMMAVSQKAYDYYAELIDARKEHVGDDVVSQLVAANADGEVTKDELIANLSTLIAGGHDTTANMVVNGLYWLLKSPEEYRKLREDPSLVPSAIEEMLRIEPSAPFPFPRCPLEKKELAGVEIPEGASIVLANHAAGRDPQRFSDPDRFDVTRYAERGAPPHLAFGFGIHRCLGENLARAELRSMFHAIVTELPELELVERGEWQHGFFRHLGSLVVAPKLGAER